MDIEMKFKEYISIKIQWKYLHVIYGLLSYLKQFVGAGNVNFNRIFTETESEFRKKVIRESEASQYRLCCKCYKEVSLQRDDYHRTVFPTGDIVWSHKDCPPTNTGEGYES